MKFIALFLYFDELWFKIRHFNLLKRRVGSLKTLAQGLIWPFKVTQCVAQVYFSMIQCWQQYTGTRSNYDKSTFGPCLFARVRRDESEPGSGFQLRDAFTFHDYFLPPVNCSKNAQRQIESAKKFISPWRLRCLIWGGCVRWKSCFNLCRFNRKI